MVSLDAYRSEIRWLDNLSYMILCDTSEFNSTEYVPGLNHKSKYKNAFLT